jgi:hypothetical protein
MGPKPQYYRRGDGALVVEKHAVFRTGTFRDSMGRQGSWEALHLDQMASHFDMLKNRGILTDVPVRDGHPGFLISGAEGNGKVVGWHTALETKTVESDSGDTTYLLASYVLTEPDAADRYERGTYRNRSAEIGTYVTNAEAEFWPVYMGVAFVDIPAVEGLNSVEFSKSNSNVYAERDVVFLFDRENPLTSSQQQPNFPAPVMPGMHSAPTQQPAQFMINGAASTDVGAIQAHITTLENFRSETLDGARVAFVSDLVKGGKILAPQQQSMTDFAKGLTDDQFANWKTAMDAAPQMSVLGQHGASTSEHGKPATGAENSELSQAKAIVRMHELAGKPEEFIKTTASYQTVQRLTAAGVQS